MTTAGAVRTQDGAPRSRTHPQLHLLSHETGLPNTRRRPVEARVLEPHPGFARVGWAVFRGCRFAQPPATFLHPSGVDVPGSNGVRDGYANWNDGHRCVRMNANDGGRRFDRVDGGDGPGPDRIHGDDGGATRRVACRHAGASGAGFRSWCPVGEMYRLGTPGIGKTEPRVQFRNRIASAGKRFVQPASQIRTAPGFTNDRPGGA